MELIRWANGKGQKLILSTDEAVDLAKALRTALNWDNYGEGEYFEVEIEDDN